MFDPMFAQFPQTPVSRETIDSESVRTHPIDWHALLSRLRAERDMRCALERDEHDHAFATMLAEGSFDPRAAEVIFSLAASAGVSGDLPERRFSPEDLEQFSRRMPAAAARLPNAKPSDCNNSPETAASSSFPREEVPTATTAPMPQERPGRDCVED